MNLIIPIVAGAALLLLSGGKPKRGAPSGDGGGGPEGGSGPSGPGRAPGKDSALKGGGFKAPGGNADKVTAAMESLCRRPMLMTSAEQRIIIADVIDPLYSDYFMPQMQVGAIDTAVLGLATKILKDCNKQTHPQSLTAAKELVRAAWWKRTGQSGQ